MLYANRFQDLITNENKPVHVFLNGEDQGYQEVCHI